MEKVGNLIFHSFDELDFKKQNQLIEEEIYNQLVEAELHRDNPDNIYLQCMLEAEKVFPEDSMEQTKLAMTIVRQRHSNLVIKNLKSQGDVY